MNQFKYVMIIASVALLSACGGDGDSKPKTQTQTQTQTEPQPKNHASSKNGAKNVLFDTGGEPTPTDVSKAIDGDESTKYESKENNGFVYLGKDIDIDKVVFKGNFTWFKGDDVGNTAYPVYIKPFKATETNGVVKPTDAKQTFIIAGNGLTNATISKKTAQFKLYCAGTSPFNTCDIQCKTYKTTPTLNYKDRSNEGQTLTKIECELEKPFKANAFKLWVGGKLGETDYLSEVEVYGKEAK